MLIPCLWRQSCVALGRSTAPKAGDGHARAEYQEFDIAGMG